MISDFDIHRSAKLLLDQHGEHACAEAMVRAVELKRTGDVEGFDVWRRIAETIADWLNVDPPAALN